MQQTNNTLPHSCPAISNCTARDNKVPLFPATRPTSNAGYYNRTFFSSFICVCTSWTCYPHRDFNFYSIPFFLCFRARDSRKKMLLDFWCGPGNICPEHTHHIFTNKTIQYYILEWMCSTHKPCRWIITSWNVCTRALQGQTVVYVVLTTHITQPYPLTFFYITYVVWVVCVYAVFGYDSLHSRFPFVCQQHNSYE